MASRPGILTDWPWKPLGSFKHVILVPWVVQNIYSFMVKDEKDLSSFLLFPILLWRALHSQLWISLSRYRTAKGNNRIIDKGIEFDQVDRESSWDDQILFNGILMYVVSQTIPGASHLPMWRLDGVILTALIHMGPVEFLYYWLHRLLHHHYLYSRYHSHHHSSIVTEPITSVIHPFAEHISYFTLFAIPLITTVTTGTASAASLAGYLTYIDFMNNMGHCNFELIPKWLFTISPPLKYLMYTPSFHSLHHTQFRTNYSLFMPIYDYIYGTMDTSSDTLYENSLRRPEEAPDVVHLTHLTTPDSIYHLRLGLAHMASTPQKIEMTWTIPKYNVQYNLQWQKVSINALIEEAVLEAEEKGVKVLSLGLLNQASASRLNCNTFWENKIIVVGEDLNRYGELYVQKYPRLKTKVVDGSSLAVAAVLNSIPKSATQVLHRGNISKVASAAVLNLCQRGIQVAVPSEDEYKKLKKSFGIRSDRNNLILSKSYSIKTWLVGDGLKEEDQKKAAEGTLFIPFSQFPPKKLRRDCFYHSIPAMAAPASLENVDSCENWLPRRVMSAWRVAGIVHALEGWDEHESGYTMSDIGRVWQASIQHGFKPLAVATHSKF
ncbi:STEROL DESATURASE [Salix viminalis]|uniref:STEROL DESATURASE n=1 Tax=Salix viminalis TaxID=40686 RepID=A0A9Q0SEE7_SALVM|nr:STEROL DESATURASE [Salix viminalis]